jgi:hypothetical protein
MQFFWNENISVIRGCIKKTVSSSTSMKFHESREDADVRPQPRYHGNHFRRKNRIEILPKLDFRKQLCLIIIVDKVEKMLHEICKKKELYWKSKLVDPVHQQPTYIPNAACVLVELKRNTFGCVVVVPGHLQLSQYDVDGQRARWRSKQPRFRARARNFRYRDSSGCISFLSNFVIFLKMFSRSSKTGRRT